MTVSFHRYGQLYFPGTGNIDEIGFGAGKHHTLNIPFESGLTDAQFWSMFQPVMQKVMDVYQPGAVVLQCGGSAHHARAACLLSFLTAHGRVACLCVSARLDNAQHLGTVPLQ